MRTLLAVVLCACGGAGEVASASQSIGVPGGAVGLPGGAVIEVPAGAFAVPVTLTVSRGAQDGVFVFGPAGMTFETPLVVHFPLPAGAQAAAVLWTRAGSDTEFEPLETSTVSGSATAPVTHFSSGYLARVPDLSGTWTGTGTYTERNASGEVTSTGTFWQARDLTQAGGNVLNTAYASSSGYAGSCRGAVGPTSVASACVGDRVRTACTMTSSGTATFATQAPATMVHQFTGTYSGSGCVSAGATLTATATMEKQVGPPIDVSGTWTGTWQYTRTGPSGSQSGLVTVTKMRHQLGSNVFDDVVSSSGAKYSCQGPIIGDTIHSWCTGSNGACTFAGQSQATVNAATGTETGTFSWGLGSGCGGFASESGGGTGARAK